MNTIWTSWLSLAVVSATWPPLEVLIELEKALADGGPYVITVEVPRDSESNPWAFIHPARPPDV